MKTLRLGVALALLAPATAHAQYIDNGSSGLAAPATTITFEDGTGDNVAIGTHYAGMTFTNLCFSSYAYLGSGKTASNFYEPGCPASGSWQPAEILFSAAVQGVALQLVSNPGLTIFEAFLGATLMGSFTAATTNPPDGNDWFGFDGSVTLDRIRIDASQTGNGAFAIDNLQVGELAQETVPEPITMVLLGTGLVAVGAARRRRRNGCD